MYAIVREAVMMVAVCFVLELALDGIKAVRDRWEEEARDKAQAPELVLDADGIWALP